MNEKDKFRGIRETKETFSLRARLTLLVGVIILVSLGLAVGIVLLLDSIFPKLESIPLFVQLNIISLIVAIIATYFISRIFFDPIKDLRNGMQKISEGDYTVRLKTKNSSKEIQELLLGFNMMAQELSSTEIIQSDFISNVSHEFKTPINAIEGYATLLQNADEVDTTNREYVDKILSNTRRLSSLVSNVLLLSKLENQQIQPQRESYNLSEQIRESIVALEPSWSPKNIDFDIDIEEIEYYGNENMMHHVWSNLLSNAIKFSPNAGQIKISLHKTNERIIFFIADNGVGLSEESKKHIFDKFYQADTSHKAEGNGLGLALVKRILALSGGTISAKNLPERGCQFTVILPIKNN